MSTSGVGQDESGQTSGVGQDESGQQELVDRVHKYRSRLDRKGVTCHMSPSGGTTNFFVIKNILQFSSCCNDNKLKQDQGDLC